jgi:hypothetical protein
MTNFNTCNKPQKQILNDVCKMVVKKDWKYLCSINGNICSAQYEDESKFKE